MIKWNEVTWYSRLGAIILVFGFLPAVSFKIGMEYQLYLTEIEHSKEVFDVETSVAKVRENRVTARVNYKCNDTLGFRLDYYENKTPTKVVLNLTDGRSIELGPSYLYVPGGTRYSTPNDSFAVWVRSFAVASLFENGKETRCQRYEELPVDF